MSLANFKSVSIRSAAILTNAYVAATILGPQHFLCDYNQLNLAVRFTIGSLTNLQIKIEYSDDGVTYDQETATSLAGGVASETSLVHEFVATGNRMLNIPIKNKYIKVSAIGTGTVTASSLSLVATLGNV